MFLPRSGATMETYVAEVLKPSNGNILVQFPFDARSGATMETYVAEVLKPSNGNILVQFPFDVECTKEKIAQWVLSIN